MMLVAAATSFLLAFGLTSWLASDRCEWKILDTPNYRSLHTRPVPRNGGVAILAGIAASWLMLSAAVPGIGDGALWAMSLSALLVAGISLLDDFKSCPPVLRFIVHCLAALVFVVAGLELPPNGWFIVSWFFLIWMTNLYNFMDGMDGFAGGMSAIGFGWLALLGWLNHDLGFAATTLVISLATLGFLARNFPPARIFMGDSGSVTLGFFAGAFSLWGAGKGIFPIWVAVLIFSPFIVDASVVLLRRSLLGERVWEPHRCHYYQRLVRLGWGHKKTVLAEYGLMLAVGASALLFRDASGMIVALVLLVWAGLFTAAMVGVHRLERMNSADHPAT
ncbi:MAG: glycosyltransferase family 4 protein [Thermodesulfobacteriota bacterium]